MIVKDGCWRESTLGNYLLQQDVQHEHSDDGFVFRYQNSLYIVMKKTESDLVRSDQGCIPCFNLKCRSVRGIKRDANIVPVEAYVTYK